MGRKVGAPSCCCQARGGRADLQLAAPLANIKPGRRSPEFIQQMPETVPMSGQILRLLTAPQQKTTCGVWRIAASVYFLAAVFGCNAQPEVADPLSHDCESRCLHTAAYIASATLGLNPVEDTEVLGNCHTSQELFLALQSRSEGVGAAVYRVPVQDLLDSLNEGPSQPLLLVDEAGHLSVLLGSFSAQGEVYYHIVHGDAPSSLLSRADITQAAFRDGWIIRGGALPGFPVMAGQQMVRVDNAWHNFGEVDPSDELHCEFALTNLRGCQKTGSIKS